MFFCYTGGTILTGQEPRLDDSWPTPAEAGSVAMPRDGDPMTKTRSRTPPPLRLSTNARVVKKGTWYFRREDVRPGPVTVSTVVATGTTEPFVFRLTIYENGKTEP